MSNTSYTPTVPPDGEPLPVLPPEAPPRRRRLITVVAAAVTLAVVAVILFATGVISPGTVVAGHGTSIPAQMAVWQLRVKPDAEAIATDIGNVDDITDPGQFTTVQADLDRLQADGPPPDAVAAQHWALFLGSTESAVSALRDGDVFSAIPYLGTAKREMIAFETRAHTVAPEVFPTPDE